jgi:membrane protein implicated in regulation of membrane protease activity
MTTIADFAWIAWLVLMALFLVIEMLTLGFTFLMLGVGCLAGLAADLIGLPIWLQVIIAAIVSVLLIFLLRPPLLRRLRHGEDSAKTNVPALIGQPGRVVETVTDSSGLVKLANGETWTARAISDGALAPGEDVRVLRIDGATAFVHKIEEKKS